jgi:hypothetical protein
MAKRGRGSRLTPPRKKHARQPRTTTSFGPVGITDGDVQWAALQVDEAADRLKGTEQAMLDAQKELANRTMLATKMSEARAVSVSAEQLANMLDQRSSEAEQRQQDAQLAKEQARQAVQRKQEASESLAGMRTKERDALEAVAELQRTLSSSEPSETSES